MNERIEVIQVNGSPMEVFLFFPEHLTPSASAPGMVLCMHIPGHTGLENDTFTLATARRYAENGHVVAVPFIFHWWPKSESMEHKRTESRDDHTVLDLNAAYDLLAAQPQVDAQRIAVLGHCWGGRVAWLAAGSNPRYKACVVFYGGRIRLAMGAHNPPAIELAPRFTCPVLGFFGEKDENPSPQDVTAYAQALEAAGIRHAFHRYEDAGHGFQNASNPKTYCHEPGEDAWQKTLAFLKVELA